MTNKERNKCNISWFYYGDKHKDMLISLPVHYEREDSKNSNVFRTSNTFL